MRRFLLISAMLFAAPASAEVIESDAAHFVTRNTVEVAASPLEAWNAFIAPANWWSSSHTFSGDAANLYLDARATGCFCEKLPLPADAPTSQQPGSVEHLHVVYVEPMRAMRLRGALGPLQSEAAEGALTVTFKAQEGKTRILFEYVVSGHLRQGMEKMAPLVDKVLAEQLERLAQTFVPGPVVEEAAEPKDPPKKKPAKPD